MSSTPLSMRDLAVCAGGPLLQTDNRTRWLHRLADETRLSYRVIRAAWHEEQMSAETEQKLKARAQQREQQNSQDYHAIASDLERIARALRAASPELDMPEIDALWGVAHQVRGLTRRTRA